MVKIAELAAKIAAHPGGCKALSEKSRVPYKTLRNIARGKTTGPRLDTVVAILQCLDEPKSKRRKAA